MFILWKFKTWFPILWIPGSQKFLLNEKIDSGAEAAETWALKTLKGTNKGSKGAKATSQGVLGRIW